MRLVIDIEADALANPKNIWLVVCKDLDTGEYHVFREPTTDNVAKEGLAALLDKCDILVGHNIVSYDLPIVRDLLQIPYPVARSIDTFLVSKMASYSREGGHSVQDYGIEFGLEKIDFTDFTKYSKDMETYCIRDVDITEKIYKKYHKFISENQGPINTEQEFESIVITGLETNGFYFNIPKAKKLLDKVKGELDVLDGEISRVFKYRCRPGREITPVYTKHGTLNLKDFRWVKSGDLSDFNGGSFCRITWEEFNPSSHKQIIEVLHDAGWSPVDKTDTHVRVEREINQLKYKKRDNQLDIRYQELILKQSALQKFGWRVNENNLGTLPPGAPAPARLLAKRILLESRRRTLTEWLGLANPETGRIHGSFIGLGTWTQRMAHQKPNTANIPNEFDVGTGQKKLLGKELRALWQAPKDRLLVGVDAESIQLRVFAHYVNDPELTNSIINGNKSDKTDPHSLNQRVFGPCCKTRNASKHSLYAIFFGGRAKRIARIMACTPDEAQEAINRLIERYPGLSKLEREQFPIDAKRGYFIGLDGRRVPLYGDTVGERKHLAMSGYLQNGEAVIMKLAALKWYQKVADLDGMLVNFVHDEWQTECPNNMEISLKIAEIQANSLREIGEDLGLKCPLAGSYYNEDHKDYTIGTNWAVTH